MQRGPEQTGDMRRNRDEFDRSGRRFAGAHSQRDRARHQKLDVPASKLKMEIARILKEEGYISNYKPAEEEGHKVLRVYLKYGANNEAAISQRGAHFAAGLPGVCAAATEIPRVLGGLGINILTTPKGVMTGRQARSRAWAANLAKSARSGSSQLHRPLLPGVPKVRQAAAERS